MPIYEYECRAGHRQEQIKPAPERDDQVECEVCGEPMRRVPSVPARRTDGIYSYAPNLGDPDKFERWHEEMDKK